MNEKGIMWKIHDKVYWIKSKSVQLLIKLIVLKTI